LGLYLHLKYLKNSTLGQREKKHLYLITDSEELIDQLRPLEGEYLLSYDSDGRLLKRINGNGKNQDIDIVITDFDFFLENINDAHIPEVSAFAPYFVILINEQNAPLFAATNFHFKCFPCVTPLSSGQLKPVISALLQNRDKVMELEERERFKILFHKAPIVQLLLNPCDYSIIDANRAAAEMYGKEEPADLAGTSLTDLHSWHADLLEEKLKEALRLGESQLNVSFESQKKGTIDLALVTSKISMGKRKLLFVNIQDITETKKTERILTLKNLELQKTNSELDNFVYSTSHELRAPLMSVLGLINLLETETDKKEQSLYVGLMKESIQKLDNIIHDIIDYSRNARFDVKVSPVDFNFLLEKTINNLHFIPGFEKIDIRVRVNEEVPFLSDKRRVEIVLNNLISNSLKFYKPAIRKPFVEISVLVGEKEAVIKVKDNGRGIPEQHLSRIFEMFFRGYEQSTGSGIGLYIVKEIVEKLNGNLHVESIEGKGSLFTVKLPNQNQ